LSNQIARVARAVLIVGAGRQSAPDGVCTAEARPSLVISVRDFATGAPALSGATITVQDGGFIATSRVPESNTAAAVGLVGERPGTYAVRVEQSGYRSWERGGIRVTADRCHARTVEVAALFPAIVMQNHAPRLTPGPATPRR
jgi:hypothetical protein